MNKIVLATRNLNKKKEIERIVDLKNVHFLSLFDYPQLDDIKEDGKDFEENAVKKALTAADFTQNVVLADDSGLEVDALNGQPGIYSARFAGENKNDKANIEKLLELLRNVPWESRRAKFRCVIALAEPRKLLKTTEGICEGIISFEPRGNFGFGYDPVFFLPSYDKTFAELSSQIKNQISHRAKAIEKIKKIIVKFGA